MTELPSPIAGIVKNFNCIKTRFFKFKIDRLSAVSVCFAPLRSLADGRLRLAHAAGELQFAPLVPPPAMLRGKLKETDIQSLNWDESEAEAEVVVAIIRLVAAPGRRTAVLRVAAPTAATAHAARAG